MPSAIRTAACAASLWALSLGLSACRAFQPTPFVSASAIQLEGDTGGAVTVGVAFSPSPGVAGDPGFRRDTRIDALERDHAEADWEALYEDQAGAGLWADSDAGPSWRPAQLAEAPTGLTPLAQSALALLALAVTAALGKLGHGVFTRNGARG